jgi:AmmeMemoRadiSam system protein B
MIRKAAVAGRFYPGSASSLNDMIEQCYKDKTFGPGELPSYKPSKDMSAIGGIVPHAGYVYSGAGAAFTVSELFKKGVPDTVIIFGTTHTGYRGIATMVSGSWLTPLGEISVDSELAKQIVSKGIAKDDPNAFIGGYHSGEHNIEVQIPWIQHAAKIANVTITIVPIALGVFEYGKIEKFTRDLIELLKLTIESGKAVKILASSDMTHKEISNAFKPEAEVESAKQADSKVIDAIKGMNPSAVFEWAEKTTVCGPQTITALTIIAKQLGYSSKILKHYTSFEKGGSKPPCDYSVGYLSAVFEK